MSCYCHLEYIKGTRRPKSVSINFILLKGRKYFSKNPEEVHDTTNDRDLPNDSRWRDRRKCKLESDSHKCVARTCTYTKAHDLWYNSTCKCTILQITYLNTDHLNIIYQLAAVGKIIKFRNSFFILRSLDETVFTYNSFYFILLSSKQKRSVKSKTSFSPPWYEKTFKLLSNKHTIS